MKSNKDTLRRSLNLSLLNGVFASAMMGFTQEYFTPFLLLLGGTGQQVGLLNALPNLFSAAIQLKSPELTDLVKSRKHIVSMFVFLQAMLLLPMAVAALAGSIPVTMFIALVILFTCCGAITNPPWGSLLADLVDEKVRGEYFGWRNRLLGFVIVASAFIAGFILHTMEKVNIFYGFALVFGGAFLWRFISWYFVVGMYEPLLVHKKEHYFTMYQFLARVKESNFVKFVLFVAMMNFSVNVASPFFSVFMLSDLKYGYLLYTITTFTATLTIYGLSCRWGKHADRIGNLKVMKFTAPLIGVIPILWILNRNPFFLIFAQVFSGFLWAGFNLATSNFIYDAVSPEKRTRCIAYYNVINGFALCAGSLVGGFLLKWLPPLCGYKILTLFLISAVLRMIVAAVMPVKLKEVKPVEHVEHDDLLFSMIGLRPLPGEDRKPIRYY